MLALLRYLHALFSGQNPTVTRHVHADDGGYLPPKP
jgi:hypothetical protein